MFAVAEAQERLPYGSRAGMDVTIIAKSGLGTSRAAIRTRHTRADAIRFCRLYVGKVDEGCIAETLAIPVENAVRGNCKTGAFTDLSSEKWRFEGRTRPSHGVDAAYAIRRINDGELADGSSVSRYGVALATFRALCPGKVGTLE